MEINFKANLISTSTIKRYAKNTDSYINTAASFVEFDLSSKKDMRVLKKIKSSWNAPLFKSIFFHAKQKSPNWKLYALTTQEDNYDKLKADNILGFAQTSIYIPSMINLEYLQVNPEYTYKNKQAIFKHIGSSIIDCLKNLESVSRINVTSILEEIDFYIKNGFFYDLDIFQESNLFWQRESTKKFKD